MLVGEMEGGGVLGLVFFFLHGKLSIHFLLAL